MNQDELAEYICDFLNSLLSYDAEAVERLIFHRTQCNDALADHPTVQVASFEDVVKVGMLGILNGLCGVRKNNTGKIGVVLKDQKIVKFITLMEGK